MKENAILACISAAYKSNYEKHRIGCILTDKSGNIISSGYNTRKTHPNQYKIQKKYGNERRIFLHAEIFAIARAARQRQSVPYNAVIIRVNNEGELRLSKPCYPCKMALQQAGVKEIYYSNNEGEIRYEKL